MLDGTKIQIEDWNKDYSFMAHGSIIGVYPIAKESINGQFAPKRGKSFRLELKFESFEAAKEAFLQLQNNEKELKDFLVNFSNIEFLQYI